MKLLLPALLLLTGTVSTVALDVRSPGNSVFGDRNFIEYVPGDLPIVISAPHGGRETPSDIPDRTNGVTEADANTQELARSIAAVIHAETGRHVHLVICRLHRSKLDVNREVKEAAQGSATAEHAWSEHHAFIDEACQAAVKQFGAAFLIDLHGHGHKDPRVELGYLHTAPQLAQDEKELNSGAFIATSSLNLIAQHSRLTYTDLIRGSTSLGALLEANGFPATPSPRMPVPTEPYFRGGFTVYSHCKAKSQVTGLQIEANRPHLRDTADNRLRFAHALTSALKPFLATHLGIGIDGKRTPAAGWSCYSLRQVPPHHTDTSQTSRPGGLPMQDLDPDQRRAREAPRSVPVQ